MAERELPDLPALLGAVMQRVPREQQPLVQALAERLAAQRYREWAEETEMRPHTELLYACAQREEDIARRIENLYPGIAAAQRAMSSNIDFDSLNDKIFSNRPVREQILIQAQAERLGAANWRRFAESRENPDERAVFLACADLEEVNAAALDGIVAPATGPPA